MSDKWPIVTLITCTMNAIPRPADNIKRVDQMTTRLEKVVTVVNMVNEAMRMKQVLRHSPPVSSRMI